MAASIGTLIEHPIAVIEELWRELSQHGIMPMIHVFVDQVSKFHDNLVRLTNTHRVFEQGEVWGIVVMEGLAILVAIASAVGGIRKLGALMGGLSGTAAAQAVKTAVKDGINAAAEKIKGSVTAMSNGLLNKGGKEVESRLDQAGTQLESETEREIKALESGESGTGASNRRVPNPHGRAGGPQHQADVSSVRQENLGNAPDLDAAPVGNRVPDLVGDPGQAIFVRGVLVDPGEGRVIVESEECFQNRDIPISLGRDQIRDIRAADPNATIVITDFKRTARKPIIYAPGEQPPPKGRLAPGAPDKVRFP